MEDTRLLAVRRHGPQPQTMIASRRSFTASLHQSHYGRPESSVSEDLHYVDDHVPPASLIDERQCLSTALGPSPSISTPTNPFETHDGRSAVSSLHDAAYEPLSQGPIPSISATDDERRSQEDAPDPAQAVCSTAGEKEELEQPEILHTYWSPFWLRRCTLLALAALFASFASALIVLWFLNNAQNGFRTTLSKNHYAWTYGPTAVLTVVLGFWRQVDFYCKIVQPWNELRKGSSDADSSILLDYLSPIQITSVIRAVRFRHATVIASIVGFATLKAVILLSTGLLVLAPVRITESHAITLTTVFDTAGFWNTVHGAFSIDTGDTYVPPLTIYDNISMFPVHAYIGSLLDRTAITTGISGNAVLPSLEPAPQDGLSDVSVEADAFVVNASCEIATVTPRLTSYNHLLVRLDTPTCSVGAERLPEIHVLLATECMTQCLNGTGSDAVFVACPERCRESSSTDPSYTDRLKYDLLRVNCSEVENEDHAINETISLDVNMLDDLRFAMLVSDLRETNLTYNLRDPGVNSSGPDKPLDVSSWPPMGAVICKIDYSMQLSTIGRAVVAGTESVSPLKPVPHLNNLTGVMLGELIYSSIYESDTFTVPGDNDASPLFTILAQSLEGEKSMARLLDAELLQLAASQAWAGIGAFFVRENLLRDASVEAVGFATRVEDCLLIKAATLWLMVAGMVLVTVLTLCIALLAPQKTVPKDPGMISTDAIVLGSSPDLQHLFKDCGAMLASHMTTILRGAGFRTVTDDGFCVAILPSEEVAETKTPEDKSRGWIPLPARHVMILSTLVTPLATIVLLEVLSSYSAAHNGLVDISGSEDEASYLSRYSSALVSLLIATCFNGLDFTTSSFAPYSLLRWGGVTASRGINLQILGSLPPIALLRSIRHRHASSFCSNLAGLIGSVLTIIASGLWVVDRAVVIEQPVAASLASRWNIEWLNSSQTGDGGAGALLDRYQHGSASMPIRIWNGTVLPDIANISPPLDARPGLAFEDFTSPLNLTFQVHGLRPLLSCEAIKAEYVTTSRSFVEMGKSMAGNDRPDQIELSVTAVPILPLGCQRAGPSGSEGHYNFTSSKTSTEHSGYLGNFYDLHLGPQTGDYDLQDYDETVASIEQGDNPAGCPSIGAILADVSSADVPPQHATAILCSQKMQQVQLNVTYSAQHLTDPTVGLNKASNVIEISVKNLTNGTDGIDTFPYRVQSYLQLYVALPDTLRKGTLTPFTENVGSISGVDVFMDHLISGPNGTLAADLVGEANQQTFIKAVSDLYARYMCFVIDMRFRDPIEPDMQATTAGDEGFVEGTAHGFSSRLQLNSTSKFIMQILLGIMTLLGACTYLLSDLRGTLPREPTSIASRMALLAGSDLCDENKAFLPRDAIWMRDDELSKIFDGWLFSIGWWQQSVINLEEADSGGDDRSRGDQAEIDISRAESISASGSAQKRKRFGIDVGVPEQLGFRETKWWGLRRRLVQHGRT